MIPQAKDWAELENCQEFGTTRRRLLPDSRHNIFLAVRHPTKQRILALRLDLASARKVTRRLEQFPGATEGIELALFEMSGTFDLELRLRANFLSDVFDVLVDDVVTVVAAAPDTAQAVDAMLARFDHWLRLLRSHSADGLNPQARRGLFGELLLLQRLLNAGVPDLTLILAWSGPDDANQDFQLPDAAVEVKTSAGREPRRLPVASERQLDSSSCGTLFLCHLVVDERRGGQGQSLLGLVDELRAAITSAQAAAEFEARVVRAGLFPHQYNLYEEPRYALRHESKWHVRDDFPRIVEADLRPGVGSCSYQVSTTGLEGYLVSDEMFLSLVVQGGANG